MGEAAGACGASGPPPAAAALHAAALALAACAAASRRHVPARLARAGYQGAYGIVVECEQPHPFDVGTMLFMDWRDDHLDAFPDIKARNAQ